MTRRDEHSDINALPPPSESSESSASSLASASSAGRPSAATAEPTLPADLRVAIDPGVQQLRGSNSPVVLLGGSPLKLLRLNPPADAIFAALARGRNLREAAHESKRSVRSVARFTRTLLNSGIVHPRWVSDVAFQPPLRSVTVVIPVYQRADELDRLLTSIQHGDTQTLEIIVVDDGSTDHTSVVAERHGARVVRHESPQGPAAARNAGLAEVTTEFVAFLDSDCVVANDWLTPLLGHFQDPQVVLVAPRISGLVEPSAPCASETTLAKTLRAYEHDRSSLDLGPQEARVVPRTRVAYVPSAALAARVEVLRELGGFATSMHVGEDVDLVWRLHEAGYQCRYEPASTVQHDHRTSPGAFVKRRFQYGTSAAELAKRHPGQVPPVAVSGWSALAWAFLASLHPAGIAASAVVVAGSSAALPRKLTSVAEPGKLAARLALRGHLGAGRQLGSALWRSSLPVALIGGLVSRRVRWTLVAAAIIPNVLEWKERRPRLDPIRYVGIRLVDDAAYCAGVWQGCVDARSLDALKPDFTSWPGRGRTDEERDGSTRDASIGSAAQTDER